MSKWIAALIVITLALALSFAQESKPPVKFPFSGGSTDLPWDIIQEDDGVAWKVAGTGNVSVEALVAGVCTAHNKVFTYSRDAANSTRRNVPYAAPDNGMVIRGNDIALFASDLLSAEELTIVGLGSSQGRVVRLKEANTEAAYVDSSALANMNLADWATVLIPLKHADPNFVVRNIQILNRSTANIQITSMPASVILTSRVNRLLKMSKLIQDIDKPGAGDHSDVIRSYELPANMKGPSAKNMIDSLFKPNSTKVTNAENGVSVYQTSRERISVSVTPSNAGIVVRATPADHELVKQAIEAMK
ncbi:MAG: hypothetical protein ACYTDT_05365 [Planctomycetota bacterium]|jgi:hypothetical protein